MINVFKYTRCLNTRKNRSGEYFFLLLENKGCTSKRMVTVAQWKDASLALDSCHCALWICVLSWVWTGPACEPGPCYQVTH